MTITQRILFFATGAVCIGLVFVAVKITPSLNLGHKVALAMLCTVGLISGLYAIWR